MKSILELRCMNDDCPYLPPLRDEFDEVDDADRKVWFGAAWSATRDAPAEADGTECPECDHQGEEIGSYTPREARAMFEEGL